MPIRGISRTHIVMQHRGVMPCDDASIATSGRDANQHRESHNAASLAHRNKKGTKKVLLSAPVTNPPSTRARRSCTYIQKNDPWIPDHGDRHRKLALISTAQLARLHRHRDAP